MKNPLYPCKEDLLIVKDSLAEALTQETIPEITLNFALGMTCHSHPNTPFISRLSSEMRQSAKFRTLLRVENPNVMEEIGISIATILEKLFPSVIFSIEGREKTLLSELNKRVTKMFEGKTPQIQDLLALRVIILNEDEEENNIQRAYQILNSLLMHFSLYNPSIDTGLSWDISVKEVSPLKDNRNALRKKYHNLYIPQESCLNPIFATLVKDYVFYPNNSGYQSLHFILSYKGIPIEVQIRTVSMHHWAEHGPAKHSVYKSKKAFQGFTLEMFDEECIGCPKYEIYGDELITYPALANAIPFFRYSN